MGGGGVGVVDKGIVCILVEASDPLSQPHLLNLLFVLHCTLFASLKFLLVLRVSWVPLG